MTAECGVRIADWKSVARRRRARNTSALRILHSAIRNQSGQALVEYAIVFPLQLLITLVIIQLAHLFVAKQVIEYSAFCAARAGLSQAPAIDAAACKRAALIPLSRITGRTGVVASDSIILPGWGALVGSGAADLKTDVRVYPDAINGQPVIVAEVTHEYELNVPIGAAVLYKLGDLTPGLDVDRTKWGTPHWLMAGSCVLAHPWGE